MVRTDQGDQPDADRVAKGLEHLRQACGGGLTDGLADQRDACPLLPGKHYDDWELDDPSSRTLEEIRPIRDGAGAVCARQLLRRRVCSSRQGTEQPGPSHPSVRACPAGCLPNRLPGLGYGKTSRIRQNEAAMTATILDGKAVAQSIREDLTQRVARLAEAGYTPGLGTVLVGDDPGSRSYVAGKHRDSSQVGIVSIRRDLPADASQQQVEDAIAELNADPACTGYIVQLPLPAGLDTQRVLSMIDPDKDSDGLQPVNLGKLVLGEPGPLPCTPKGIVELLRRYQRRRGAYTQRRHRRRGCWPAWPAHPGHGEAGCRRAGRRNYPDGGGPGGRRRSWRGRGGGLPGADARWRRTDDEGHAAG